MSPGETLKELIDYRLWRKKEVTPCVTDRPISAIVEDAVVKGKSKNFDPQYSHKSGMLIEVQYNSGGARAGYEVLPSGETWIWYD